MTSDLVQVLVWKTNFDSGPSERLRPPSSSKPHCYHGHIPSPSLHDHKMHGSSALDHVTAQHDHVTNQRSSHHLNTIEGPRDIVTPPSNIVNVGPCLFHRGNQSDLHRQHDLSAGSCDPAASLPAYVKTVPVEPMPVAPQLASTLEHIVGQLDILTQVGVCVCVCGGGGGCVWWYYIAM